MRSIRVCLQNDFTTTLLYAKLIDVILLNAPDVTLPNTTTDGLHSVDSSIPFVKVTDNGYTPCVRCPYAETPAFFLVFDHVRRTEKLIAFSVGAFVI